MSAPASHSSARLYHGKHGKLFHSRTQGNQIVLKWTSVCKLKNIKEPAGKESTHIYDVLSQETLTHDT